MRLTDPATMRALAHPVRLDLIWYLLEVDSATSTQCASALGHSQATCSYHLRQLAAVGFVEPIEAADRRQHPWRLAVRSFDLISDTDEQRLAANALLDQLMHQDASVVRQFRAERQGYSKQWRDAVIDRRTTAHLTSSELAELGARVEELLAPYVERELRRDRPARAERVYFTFQGIPWRTSPTPRH